MILRDYQNDIIKNARQLMMDGVKTILIQSSTGSGKTILAANMLKTASDKGMDCLFVCHRREILLQATTAFSKCRVRHGIIAAGFQKDYQPHVQLASIQTLVHRLCSIRKPKLIIWDECHHLSAGSWRKVFKSFPDAFHIGLSATPWRLSGEPLGEFFSKMVLGPEMEWLIENNFLSKYKIYAPPTVNMTGLHTRMGDFISSEVTAIFDKPTIIGNSVTHYLKYAAGKKAIVFAASIEHSKHIAAAFNAAGITAAHVDGETESSERDALINKFKNGSITILSNVSLFGEGVDLPLVEVVIDVAPTLSLSAYLQRFGRALRPSPGKDMAIYIDQCGAFGRHGFPDEIREWSLDGIAKNKKQLSNVHTKVCKKCFAAMKIGCDKCIYCGYEFPIASRVLEEVAGDLVEIDPEQIRKVRKVEQSSADTEQKLIDLGKSRGYKRAELWAKHIMLARIRGKR